MDPGVALRVVAMAWLTIDRGNTTLDCRVVSGDKVLRLRFRPPINGLTRVLDQASRDGHVVEGLLCCCVVAPALDDLRREASALGLPLRSAGPELPCPLRVDYPKPVTLGVDRWVAAFAASRRFGDTVLIDCGTAVTVDGVTADGHFLGGTIGAGLGLQARALAAAAPALPQFDRRPPDGWPPNTSLDAVRAGVGLGFVEQVRGLCERHEARWPAGRKAPLRVVTGGDAEELVDLAPDLGLTLAPGLIHDGLLLLEEFCASNS